MWREAIRYGARALRGRSGEKNADSWNAASPMNIVEWSRCNMMLTVNYQS